MGIETKGELVVMKHGSSVVGNANQIGMDQSKVDFHALQHVRLRAEGVQTIEVSSGAAVAGKEYMQEMGENPKGDNYSTAEWAVYGTARQLRHWEYAARPHGILVGQILATHQEIDDNIGQFSPGVFMVKMIRDMTWDKSLIVANENDAAAIEEMEEWMNVLDAKFRGEADPESDNDWLAAHLAIATGATALLLLTNEDGFKVDGEVVPELAIEDIDSMLEHCYNTEDDGGTGGMKSKLLATEKAAEAGIQVVIGNAFTDVRHMLEGEAGTRVVQ